MNPTIFANSITGSDWPDAQLRSVVCGGTRDAQQLFFALALDEIRKAARELRPAYEASQGRDAFISFECTRDLPDDTETTSAQATDLWERLEERDVTIKAWSTGISGRGKPRARTQSPSLGIARASPAQASWRIGCPTCAAE